MNKKYVLKQKIRTRIPNIHCFLEDISAKEVLITDYNGTSHILKSIYKTAKTGTIEVSDIKQKAGIYTCSIIYIPNFLYTDKFFSIIQSSSLCFIPIDGLGGLSEGKESHCDFIFFNQENFCFVELKLNAISLKEETIRDNREKAVSQLKHTIGYFDTVLTNDYCGMDLEAYIATPDTYPRENTAFQAIKIKFLEETRIELYESRIKQYN